MATASEIKAKVQEFVEEGPASDRNQRLMAHDHQHRARPDIRKTPAHRIEVRVERGEQALLARARLGAGDQLAIDLHDRVEIRGAEVADEDAVRVQRAGVLFDVDRPGDLDRPFGD